MSAWQEYKKKLGTTRPWDLLKQDNYHYDESITQYRMKICSECPEFISLTKQCKQCGCVMVLKAKLKNAQCPLKKW